MEKMKNSPLSVICKVISAEINWLSARPVIFFLCRINQKIKLKARGTNIREHALYNWRLPLFFNFLLSHFRFRKAVLGWQSAKAIY